MPDDVVERVLVILAVIPCLILIARIALEPPEAQSFLMRGVPSADQPLALRLATLRRNLWAELQRRVLRVGPLLCLGMLPLCIVAAVSTQVPLGIGMLWVLLAPPGLTVVVEAFWNVFLLPQYVGAHRYLVRSSASTGSNT
jgi:hypothetical protein